MGLKAAEQQIDQKKPGPRCGFGSVLENLDPDDAAYYDQMVADGKTWAHITRVFREDGHKVSVFTARRHGKGDCSCR